MGGEVQAWTDVPSPGISTPAPHTAPSTNPTEVHHQCGGMKQCILKYAFVFTHYSILLFLQILPIIVTNFTHHSQENPKFVDNLYKTATLLANSEGEGDQSTLLLFHQMTLIKTRGLHT